MKFSIVFWLLMGLFVSCASHATPPTETWVMEATAVDATTGEVKGKEVVKDPGGHMLTFKNGPDCVKAALDMGPMPVHDNIAISIVCHKVETI